MISSTSQKGMFRISVMFKSVTFFTTSNAAFQSFSFAISFLLSVIPYAVSVFKSMLSRFSFLVLLALVGCSCNHNAQSCWVAYQALRSPAGLY